MGRLKKMLTEAFSGGRAVPRAATPLGVLLDEVRRVTGSRRAASRATGIPESTLRRWEKTGRPKDPTGATLKLTTGIRATLRAKAEPPAGGKVEVRLANPGKGPRTRKVAVDPGALERAGEAFDRGDYGGMVREFRAGITNEWYRETLFKPDPGDESYDDDEDLTGEGAGYDDPDSIPIAGAVSW